MVIHVLHSALLYLIPHFLKLFFGRFKNVFFTFFFLDNPLDGVTVEEAMEILDADMAQAQKRAADFRSQFGDKLNSEVGKKSPFKDVVREARQKLTPPKKFASPMPVKLPHQQSHHTPQQEEEVKDLRNDDDTSGSKDFYRFFYVPYSTTVHYCSFFLPLLVFLIMVPL